MGHEISQFDIQDRQLLSGSAQPGMWSDIGEAKITHTIFGRPKVRVIREKDRILRKWMLAALAAMALAAAGWQGWVALRQNELQATPPLSERISIGPPVFHPEIIPAAKPAGRGKSESLIQTEIDSLVSNPNGRPPKPAALNATKPMASDSIAALPSTESKLQPNKPQTAPLVTNNVASMKQTGAANQTLTQSHSKVSAPVQPATTAVMKPATAAQPAVKEPAPATPAEPLSKKDTAKPLSASNNQTSDTANVEPDANARGTAIIYVQPDNAKP
jgi:hypothetical protein